ncbi:hypothetical protein Cni_G11262 [Canna indica]|uniref:Uncharacterized protein n=1 Tax=Canna indica TaxID=4628 RepID=A0AAQ3K8D5_9LILI|nr:hypothetical protein Cni_G11262 [Canna indica]
MPATFWASCSCILLQAFRISSFSNLQDDAVRENDLELRLGVGGLWNRLAEFATGCVE